MRTLERQRQDGFRRTLHALRPQDDVRKLEGRIEELETENAWLRGLVAPTIMAPPAWGLTASQDRILALLLDRTVVSIEAIMAALYAARGKDEPEGGASAVKVFLHSLRGKLRLQGIVLHNHHGRGWYIEPADRTRLRAELLSGTA